ncbi:MAG: nucleoside phosphorylase [Candidatus Thorarchaeota archaeon]
MSNFLYPILEFDPSQKAIIDPKLVYQKIKVPKICLFTLYYHITEKFSAEGLLEKVYEIESTVTHPFTLYRLEYKGKEIAIASSALGAPYAASVLEIAIAHGCTQFLVIGSCGVLENRIQRNQFVIPNAAIRDEGTSYHYVAPSREIEADSKIVGRISSYLSKNNIKNIIGKTWTTDAFFRETFGKIKRRKAEGAVIVEMEAAALFAVAKFRNVKLGYILAGGDDVSGLEWDRRLKMRSADFYERFFWLAVEICQEIYS